MGETEGAVISLLQTGGTAGGEFGGVVQRVWLLPLVHIVYLEREVERAIRRGFLK